MWLRQLRLHHLCRGKQGEPDNPVPLLAGAHLAQLASIRR
jgi:hypothetical protein